MRLSARLVASIVAALVVLSPLARAPTSDTYPLSTYPMFAGDRGAVHDLPTAVELLADGAPRRLSPSVIAGTEEPVLAGSTVARAIRDGRAQALCEEIAGRLGPGRSVEVRTETIDTVEMIARGAEPLAVRSHARCGAEPVGNG